MKLAYIYNIMKFVYWDDENIKFCISGFNPFGNKLKSITNKKIQNREISLSNSFNIEDLKECSVIFISKSEKYSFEAILESIEKKEILTISDIEKFAKSGGMVELQTVNEKISILVNLKKVNESNIKISAKLLEVATILRD